MALVSLGLRGALAAGRAAAPAARKALAGEVFPPLGRYGTKAHAIQMPSARLSDKAPLACPPARGALRGRR